MLSMWLPESGRRVVRAVGLIWARQVVVGVAHGENVSSFGQADPLLAKSWMLVSQSVSTSLSGG